MGRLTGAAKAVACARGSGITSMGDISSDRTLGGKGGREKWSLAEGATLGGYRIVRPLGRGGMGEVYLAENVQTGVRYALKLLPSDLASDSGFRERFRREATVLQTLRHDGIVMVHHAAEEGGRFFLTMDYVEGGTLGDLIKEWGKLTGNEVARIALEICDALAYAHEKGIVHRDLKPSNVLMGAGGRAKLSDFGLARVVGDEFLKGLTQRSVSLSTARTGGDAKLSQSDDAVIGTYEYMSPEQKAGAPADERSDIFSLGLVIYRMLTGEKAEGVFDMPSEFGCSKAWDPVIKRCLRQRPEERYASAAELVADLERAAPPTSLRFQIAAGLAVVALVIGGITAGLVISSKSRGKKEAPLAKSRRIQEEQEAKPTARDEAARSAQYQKWMDKSLELKLDGKLLEAAQAYDEAAKYAPDGSAEAAGRAVECRVVHQLRQAEKASGRGDRATAILCYDRAIGLRPNDARLYVFRGVAKCTKDDWDGGMRDYDKAVALDPTNAGARCRRASIYLAEAMEEKLKLIRGDREGAIPDYDKPISECDKVIGFDPTNIEAFLLRGDAKRQKGDLDDAVRDFDQAIRIDPRSADAYASRASAKQDMGDLQGAVQDYDRAVALEPKSASHHSGRGSAKLEKGDLESAIRDYEKATELNPRFARTLARVHVKRGKQRMDRNDTRGVMRDLDRAIELDPRNTDAYHWRTFLKERKGDLKGAMRDHDKLVELNPKNAIVYASRATARRKSGDSAGAARDYKEAIRLCDQRIRLKPKDPVSYSSRASVKTAMGDEDGAIADYGRAIEVDSKNIQAYWDRGLARARKHDWQGAIRDFKKGKECWPDGPRRLHTFGDFHYKKQEWSFAIRYYDMAIELNPDDSHAYYGRGRSKKANGDISGANRDFETAHRLGYSGGR